VLIDPTLLSQNNWKYFLYSQITFQRDLVVATTKLCWNEMWLFRKPFETFYEHVVWSIFR